MKIEDELREIARDMVDESGWQRVPARLVEIADDIAEMRAATIVARAEIVATLDFSFEETEATVAIDRALERAGRGDDGDQ